MGKFVPFEKSPKDKESKKFGKEGSKREEAWDKKQGMACGGKVKGHAAGGMIRGTGAATKGKGWAGEC